MILGVEGGGSQTRIAAKDAAGAVRFRQFDVSIKFREIGIDVAAARLAELIEEHYERPAAIAIALSGAADTRDQRAFEHALAERLNIEARNIRVESDSAITLDACPTTTLTKVVLIAGTGSVCLGMDAHGDIHSIGGWGPLLGDEGSGREIGRAALTHLTHVIDRREKATKLSDALRSAIGLEGAALSGFLKSASVQPAAFATIVFETESEKSTEILDAAAFELAKLVQAVLLRVAANSERPRELFLSGSVAKSGAVIDRLKRHLPLMKMTPLDEDAPARALLGIAGSLE